MLALVQPSGLYAHEVINKSWSHLKVTFNIQVTDACYMQSLTHISS